MERKTREESIGANAPVTASLKTIEGKYATHRHDFYEIEFFIDGDGDYVVDGARHRIRPGMLFFMTPLNFHSVNAAKCHAYNVMFSEGAADFSLLTRLLSHAGATILEANGEDRTFFLSVFHELATNLSDSAYRTALLDSILGKTSRLSNADETVSSPIASGLLYLLQHFRENPSLAEVASHAGFTPTYFSAIFKRDAGVTYKAYSDNLRLEYAKKLLDYSELSVSQVCAESGFSDYPNFIRRFKSRYGVTPGSIKERRTQNK